MAFANAFAPTPSPTMGRLLRLLFLLLVVYQLSHIVYPISLEYINNNLRESSYSAHDINNHCFFVLQNLWGDHDDVRTNQTLTWYRDITLASIYATNPVGFRQVYLLAKDRYAKEVPEAISSDQVVMMANFTEHMRASIAKHQCGAITFMRLDSDDMLQPQAFQNIQEAWDGKVRRVCGKNSPRCQSHLMVSGTRLVPTLQIHRAVPIAAASCDLQYQSRSTFLSQGLAVTLTPHLWETEWNSNPRLIYSEQHDFLLKYFRKRLGRYRVWEAIFGDNHSLFVQTALSSHARTVDGDCSAVVAPFDPHTQQLLQRAVALAPSLSVEQRKMNTFVQEQTASKRCSKRGWGFGFFSYRRSKGITGGTHC